MIIAIVGASGTGKSTLERLLVKKYGLEKIISYTTRNRRPNEKQDVDYHYITKESLLDLKAKNLFIECEEYSENRYYGTFRSDYEGIKDKVVVLTPNGLRQIKKNLSGEKIFYVLMEASLGVRYIRYIKRCGIDKFNFSDKNEISARVERDYGMFLGIQNEADMIVTNNWDNEIDAIAKQVYVAAKEKSNEQKEN